MTVASSEFRRLRAIGSTVGSAELRRRFGISSFLADNSEKFRLLAAAFSAEGTGIEFFLLTVTADSTALSLELRRLCAWTVEADASPELRRLEAVALSAEFLRLSAGGATFAASDELRRLAIGSVDAILFAEFLLLMTLGSTEALRLGTWDSDAREVVESGFVGELDSVFSETAADARAIGISTEALKLATVSVGSEGSFDALLPAMKCT